jgi:hypothetical protein
LGGIETAEVTFQQIGDEAAISFAPIVGGEAEGASAREAFPSHEEFGGSGAQIGGDSDAVARCVSQAIQQMGHRGNADAAGQNDQLPALADVESPTQGAQYGQD